ncbi:MAG: Asp-tRNA(Asn)/Glu-tRNA(Gln) amidotransferase subunit GatB, partial [bacterium]|nr:Asp-tRNA(Asn)/Glu-tRNA(Gln) amidotransferase subunit GatB [bacterium]
SLACPVCLALPGALPVPNRRAVEFAIRLGLALGCTIRNTTKFNRKNYFYPDLPKGYQISQYDEPICENGVVKIIDEGVEKNIRIQRIHIEEDAGKSSHTSGDTTLVDLNRCGAPLLEIVSHPDLRSPREAYLYLSYLKELVERLEISNGNMEEGSLRCDANISLRPVGTEKFGTRTEVKNVNSLRYVEKALHAEYARQKDILEAGGIIEQQTLTFDEKSGTNKFQRSKEESQDYRYFPEPDLVRFDVPMEWIESVRSSRTTYQVREQILANDCGFSPEHISEIMKIRSESLRTPGVIVSNYYSGSIYLAQAMQWSRAKAKTLDPAQTASTFLNKALGVFKARNEDPMQSPLTPEKFAAIEHLRQSNAITGSTANELFERIPSDPRDVQEIVDTEGLAKVADTSLIDDIVVKVVTDFAKQVEEYRSGKVKVFEFLLGQVMKLTRGKADPDTARASLRRALDS